jgi:hypothetical protein
VPEKQEEQLDSLRLMLLQCVQVKDYQLLDKLMKNEVLNSNLRTRTKPPSIIQWRCCRAISCSCWWRSSSKS